MVNGKFLMRDSKLLTVDEASVFARAKTNAKDLLARANIVLPDRFRMLKPPIEKWATNERRYLKMRIQETDPVNEFTTSFNIQAIVLRSFAELKQQETERELKRNRSGMDWPGAKEPRRFQVKFQAGLTLCNCAHGWRWLISLISECRLQRIVGEWICARTRSASSETGSFAPRKLEDASSRKHASYPFTHSVKAHGNVWRCSRKNVQIRIPERSFFCVLVAMKRNMLFLTIRIGKRIQFLLSVRMNLVLTFSEISLKRLFGRVQL